MPHIVSGALKDYDWGIVDGLARWHGATGTAQAELWFGTHPFGPTVVVVNEGVARNLSTQTLKDDVYAFFSDQQGLMAGVSIEGSPTSTTFRRPRESVPLLTVPSFAMENSPGVLRSNWNEPPSPRTA